MDFHPSILIDTARFTSSTEVPCGADLPQSRFRSNAIRRDSSNDRRQASILGGGKHVILIMDTKRLAMIRGVARNLISQRICTGHEVSRNS